MSLLDPNNDFRKEFILTTIANYFGLAKVENKLTLINNADLNNFLDDGSNFILSSSVEETELGKCIRLDPRVLPNERKDQILVFFKIRPQAISADNLHENIFVSSMVDSPITMLYHSVQKVFAPIILKDSEWSEKVDPKLQDYIIQLESGLKNIVSKSSASDGNQNTLSVIMTPMDEINFWSYNANSSSNKAERNKATAFWTTMEPLAKYLSSLDCIALVDVDDVLETAHNTLDDLWKLEDFIYPQERMEHFMDTLGNTIARFLQSKLKELRMWEDPYTEIEAVLNQSIAACDKWAVTCQRLTSLFWSNYTHHRWRGNPYTSLYITDFSKRLQEILQLRTLHRQMSRLLSPQEQEELKTASTFTPFTGLNPVQYNLYTEPLWRTAVNQFENALVPTEDRIASKLKYQLQNINRNTLQVLQEFKRYEDLIQRPNVRNILVAERENLLGQLQDYTNQISSDFHSGQDQNITKLVDLPQVISNIYWVQRMECKIKDVQNTSAKILNNLNGYEALQRLTEAVLKDLKEYHTDQFDSWTRDVGADIQNNKLSLRTNEPVVKFEQGKLMHVNYNLRLVGLIREVRQLAVLGYKIPIKIQESADTAKRFMKQAKALQQVANFHNTIGDRMIPSQRPMMLEAALKLAQLVDEQNGVTWSDTKAVDRYIAKLQVTVERLSKENNKLASYHSQVSEKVMLLINTDLLRQTHQWKAILKDIRTIIGQVEEQKFTNLKSWRSYWDRQLYKALEYQYKIGLSALNEHLPEMKIELVYRDHMLQYHPPMDDIRTKYYELMDQYFRIPSTFRGVSDTSDEASIFPIIITRNAHRFAEVYAKGERLLMRLDKLKNRWGKWVSLDAINMEQLGDKNLRIAENWTLNFRASKTLGQDIAKLPYTDEKLGCFSISFLTLRSEIEVHNRRYWDFLNNSLKASIVKDLSNVEKFIAESTEVLLRQPRTVEEIGQANFMHSQILETLPQMVKIFEGASEKNNSLSIWTKDRMDQVVRMSSTWDNFQTLLDNHQYLISKQVEGIKNHLMTQVDTFGDEVEKFNLRWDQLKPRETSLQDGDADVLHKSLTVLREKRQEWEALIQTKDKLINDCTHFGLESPKFEMCEEVEADLKRHESMWALFDNFNKGLESMTNEEWIIFRSKSYKFEEFLQKWQDDLKIREETTSLTVRLLQEVEKYKMIVPSLKYIRGDMFSDKHWLEMFSLIGIPSKPVETLKFGDFLNVKENIVAKADQLQELNTRASSEIVIRQALGELDIWEVEAKFALTPHIDSQGKTIMLIKDFKDILNKIGDNQCLLQSIKNSPNFENFSDRAVIWETRLADLDEFLHNLNQIQRKWVYLEPIFGVGTLSQDQARFKRVNQDFCYIMGDVAKDNKVVSLCRISNLHQMLNNLLDQLSRCQKSLNDFLEEKRSVFPRFYFLGDDDLLEILGQSTKERVIQAHLKKLFAGIHSVLFDSNGKHITAIKSIEGEVVNLRKHVPVIQQVEVWLSNLSSEMKSTLSHLLLDCFNDVSQGSNGPDPLKYPSQILCLSESITFTSKCEQAITGNTLKSLHMALKTQLDAYTRLELEWADVDTDGDSLVLELKLKALLLDTIHHMSIVEHLMETNITSVDEWQWQKQLRFYLQKDGVAVIRMVDAEFQYTYEYQGNVAKLVHTPLTDKCYLTLTQAMHMGLGGNPYGPAGTGKTESVKALGGFLGRQVLVFNCDEGIDVKSMARIFVGLVKCGAWGCFDEFNRLEEATLSAISMQIQPIQTAIKNRYPMVKLLDVDVPLDTNCGIFVTLNPAGKGYGGRQKLPDNLKQLFRPVVMSRPDNELIAEVILYCEGFAYAKDIGRKLVEVFDLSRKLLTTQQHYDWGLRALKTVLGGCGSILKSTRKFLLKENVDAKTLEIRGEMKLVVQILRLNTLSKLTFADSLQFDALVKDVFPDIPFSSSGFDELTNALKESCLELGLLNDSNQIRKCLELYEQLQQRMGVVIVGPSGSGKSTLRRLLKHALVKLGKAVKQHTINPKAMPRTQLLGQIDLDTRQWTDGVLTLSALQVYSEPLDIHSWIVCDGDVDPEWIESLNSVLDDNRLLTLPSGWRIQFGPNVNFVFETHDLSYASPATISRMGMIFLSDEDINVKGMVTAWLQTQQESTLRLCNQLIDDYFYKGVQWVIEQGDMVVATSLVGVVHNGLSQLHGVVSKSHFTVALIRGLGGNLTPASRETFAKLVFDWTGEYIQQPNKLLFSYYNPRRDCIDVYTMDSDETVQGLLTNNSLSLIMTADVKRTLDIVEPWLQSEMQQPFLLVGPQGCGKRIYVLVPWNTSVTSSEGVAYPVIFLSRPARVSTIHIKKQLVRLEDIASHVSWIVNFKLNASVNNIPVFFNVDENLILNHCFSKLRSTEIATIHCSAQITPQHVLQKLSQVCMVISSNTGRVYRPKNSEHLILYFKDLNLARPDKWGTSMLIAFLQQIITYSGFYDNNLEWVGLERVQIVGSMTAGTAMGRHSLTTRFTSITRIYTISYPDPDDLSAIFNLYLSYIMSQSLSKHPVWKSANKMSNLAGSMINIYEEVKINFTPMMQNHYLFTPRDLTRWCLGLLRYDLKDGTQTADHVLQIVVYEGMRLFRDKLVCDDERHTFDMIIQRVLETDWNKNQMIENLQDVYYVSTGTEVSSIVGAPLPPFGKPLSKLEQNDWTKTVECGITQFGRESQSLDLLIFTEVLRSVACIDRVLSAPRGSLLLAGRAGVGRKSAVRIVSALHSARLITLKMGQGYSVKNFKNDLKSMMLVTGVEGEQVYLLLEDHQLVDISFLDMINSLLSSGEVPGLYNLEELEPLVSSLKDIAAQEGFVGSPTSFFAERVQKNLHVILIMDYTNNTFTFTCESNPALYKQCSVHWLDGWSAPSMREVPRMLLAKYNDVDSASTGKKFSERPATAKNESLINGFLSIHERASSELSTPRRYIAFIHMYIQIYNAKRADIQQRQYRLQAGVSKLTDARKVVDTLKSQAAGQEDKLAEKQAKANSALQMITETMRNANMHKGEMETLKEKTEKENQQLAIRKKVIDAELVEVEPLIREASAAVGNIKSEALSEIRSLRAPPDVIRDILEGVLRLMGILDTSWNSMKTFLAKRGIKEDIRTFDAHIISTESRLAVEKLLIERKESFEPRNAKRASVAAAPLASWVTANVKYAHVLEKIRPLELEQRKLESNMNVAKDQIGELSTGLTDVDMAVSKLKDQLNTYTKEAAEIEIHLNKAQETINAAEGLIGKLNDEYERWKLQLSELSDAIEKLPLGALLAAAFITYLSASPEDVRKTVMAEWQTMLGIQEDFSLNKFLGSEKDQLQWLSEGLPSDQLSIQNALIILQTSLRPFLIDPSSLALEWLKKHLQDKTVEVVSQYSERFTTILELAIRFGKILIIQEVDQLNPVLFPILRGDFINQGPRKVVQVGDKLIDYNDKFQLFLTTRVVKPVIPPDASAVITFVNFTTTWAGLTGQLLACALRQERPELEKRRGELLRQEEELKVKLDILQEILLHELAVAQGDILQNKELLSSLNETKASSAAICQSLEESSRLQAELNKECDVYLPLAEYGSSFYFVIADLGKVNNMYQFSVGSFTRLFQKVLTNPQDGESVDRRTKNHQDKLQQLAYQFVGRSLFKEDRLMFALHIVHKMYPKTILQNEWETFTGQTLSDIKVDPTKLRDHLPAWIEEERAFDVFLLKNSLPQLYSELQLDDNGMWSGFHRSGECEQNFPVQTARKLTTFQQVLVVQALRPDRLHSSLTQFALQALGLRDLSSTALSLKQLLSETIPSEPILLVISPGADPSEEVRALAEETVGSQHYYEVAMGQGQVSVALEYLNIASKQGHWLCLKNLHLMTYWLPRLEMELKSLQPHDNFRLWLTAEAHPKFSSILAQSCLKVTYEAPQGIKKNLQRTYAAWGPDFIKKDGGMLRAQALFALAWFHAVVQERRTYIPQGWAKFYEFSDADLKAAAQVISQLFTKGSNNIRWEFVHGLCENAIYGGRVDNVNDIRVLASYLREFFSLKVLTQNQKSLGPIFVPTSADIRDYSTAILKIADNDKPSYFGLPANVERSWQRITSHETINNLRTLTRSLEGVNKFNRDEWQALLSPILNLWKKLNQGSGLIQLKLPTSEDSAGKQAPVSVFIEQEFCSALVLVKQVHKSLSGLSKVIRGTNLPSGDNSQLADEIINHQTPSLWQKLWDGPTDPLLYLRSLIAHSLAIEQWYQRSSLLLTEPLDLSDLFHPDTFLSALKQQTARDLHVPIDELHLSCSWSKHGVVGARLAIKITGLQLEGAGFDGDRLVGNTADSPSIFIAPPCSIAWLPKCDVPAYNTNEMISLPVYYTCDRERVVMSLNVPCAGELDKWIQSGAAFFLRT